MGQGVFGSIMLGSSYIVYRVLYYYLKLDFEKLKMHIVILRATTKKVKRSVIANKQQQQF